MPKPSSTSDDFLTISRRVRVLPIIHGSGDFAIRVREELLARPYDCVALPLPPSFQDEVEAAVERLPSISAVLQENDDGEGFSHVPIDPCQGVISAIRTAIGERIPREFIDLEAPCFETHTGVFPDPYALKRSRVELFSAALLPSIPPPRTELQADRVRWMAHRLRDLERRHALTLLVCSLLDWPWIRDAYQRRLSPPPMPEPRFAPIRTLDVDPSTLLFLLGELPFITGLYERGRIELTDDDNLSVDGIKEMVLAARDRLKASLPRVAQRISPQILRICFQYVRNLALMDRRLTPDLYTLVTAARQTAGDDFALSVAETAREYPHTSSSSPDEPLLRMSVDRAELPDEGIVSMTSRLPGQKVQWRACELRPRPPEPDRKRWRQRWNPYGMCSWPPEDTRIESFQKHVRDQAKALLGADLARSEKFSTSLKDGLDLRETLRHWHTGDLFVKVIPPSRGTVEVVVFLFDTPADPRRYVNRATWFAEHNEESTLAFYSTDPMQDMIGPGIARAEYGGAFFLFPPRLIPDIWTDPRFDFTDTLEDRLLAGALYHGREKHVALVSPRPPSASWRRLSKRFGRSLLHIPLSRFSTPMIERLRRFHVLNGKIVRSYAADYIRDM